MATLRSKATILSLFVGLAPTMAISVVIYRESLRALDAVVESKAEALAQQAARGIAERRHALDVQLGGIASDRSVSGYVTRPRRSPDAVREGAARERLATLLSDAAWVELRDSAGKSLLRLDSRESSARPICSGARPLQMEAPIFGAAGEPVGKLVAAVYGRALLPRGSGAHRFGESGTSLLVDRRTDAILYSTDCAKAGQSLSAVSLGFWKLTAAKLDSLNSFQFAVAKEQFVGERIELADGSLAFILTASLSEFERTYKNNLGTLPLLLVLVALLTIITFLVLVQGTIRSMEDLTHAADRITRGDRFAWLPPPTGDDIGRLSLAFARTLERIRETEKEAALNQELASLGRMSSHLAHEVRNPLSALQLNLQSLRRELSRGSVPDDFKEVIGICLSEVRRLDDVVKGMLAVGRGVATKRSRASLHATLEHCVKLLSGDFGRRGVYMKTFALARADEALVQSKEIEGVILNLLLNAADAMPDGGTIRLWTENGTLPDGAPSIAIHVCDEGGGVPRELREKIFQPFFTTKEKGSGIGLAIARRVAEQHHGRIWYEERTELVGGAEFVLALPLAPDAAEALAALEGETTEAAVGALAAGAES